MDNGSMMQNEVKKENKPENIFSQERLNLSTNKKNEEYDSRLTKAQHESKKRALEQDADELSKKLAAQKKKTPESFKEKNIMQEQLFADKVGALEHDYKWYGQADSPRMQRVKTSLRNIVSIMNKSVKKTPEGDLDYTAMRDEVTAAYKEAIEACDDYRKHTPAKHTVGKRRLAMVRELCELVKMERENFKIVVDSAANHSFDLTQIKKVSDLMWNIKSPKVVSSTWQPEGNSTDVYLVETESEDGTIKKFYVKENLKMICDDLPGYFTRRKARLVQSKAAFDEGNEEGQEERLAEGKLRDEDYTGGINVLNVMERKLAGASGRNKEKIQDRMLDFLGQNFDAFFKDYTSYNNYMRTLNSKQQDLDAIIAELRGNEKNACLVKALEAQKTAKVHKTLTQSEYLVARIKDKTFKGLDIKKDKDIIDALKKLDTEDNRNGLKKFLTRTLGKEVELYGQQREGGGKVSNDEILATNNIATGRIAKTFGFGEEVTGSILQKMTFERKNEKGKPTEMSCTVIDPAEGDEMLTLVKKAENEHLTLTYSPKVIRKLMRLQMFDTVCLQTDRHWRNFKCTWKQEDGKLVVTDMKSYDHDMSFGNRSLKEAFTDEKKGHQNKVGFLPNLMTEVKTSSPEFAYLVKTGMVGAGPEFLNLAEEPLAFFKERKDAMTAKNHESWGWKWHQINGTKEYGGIGWEMKDWRYEHAVKPQKGDNIYDQEKVRKSPLIPSNTLLTFAGSLRKKNGEFLDDAPHTEKGELPKPSELCEEQITLCKALDNIRKFSTYSIKREDNFTHSVDINVVDDEKIDEKNRYVWSKDSFGKVEKDNASAINITKKELGSLMESLKDVSDILDTCSMDGNTEFTLRWLLYNFRLMFGNNDKARKAFAEAESEKTGEPVNVELSVKVPSMLHMDHDAYLKICDMAEHFENVRFLVKDLNWDDAKIEALHTRITEMVASIDAMKNKVEEEILHKKYSKDDPRYNFFLEEADYEKPEFTDIKDFVWNPSMSYLGIEDPNYLYGDEDFLKKSNVSSKEIDIAKDETNEMRKVPRQRLDEMKPRDKYHSIVGSKIAK